MLPPEGEGLQISRSLYAEIFFRIHHPPCRTVCVCVCVCGVTESTVGADASVEMPKLHNIKLLIALYKILMMNIFALINFAACKLNEWVMIDHDCC